MSDDSSRLTPEEQQCSFETLKHIEAVRNVIDTMILELLDRARDHDQEKLKSPELQYFANNPVSLEGLTFGSPEYEAQKKKHLQPALEHHYARYRHHPEHFNQGIDGMNLIDLVEMFCDWKASSSRQHNGNLLKSIETSAERFKISPQLVAIFKNTADYLDQIHR
jgi:hypothetical protein